MSSYNISLFEFFVASLLCLLVWQLILMVYRLYLSPIAHFPGPSLAAISQWYEIYYDIYLNGQFTLHVKELHELYGPIVRINPWELSINDPEFYETIYSTSRFDKVPEHEWWGNATTAAQATVSHDLHRIRRAAQNPFFSKRQISNYAPEIQARADKLCNRLNTEYKNSGKILQMTSIFGCFTADIVTEYAFAKDYKYLDSPDFQARFVATMQDLGKNMHVLMLFPWLLTVLVALPQWLVKRLNHQIGEIFAFQADIKQQIEDIIEGRNEKHRDVSHPTILKELIDSNLPPQEKSMQRLQHEGQVIVGAGLETVKWTMCVALFYALDNLEINQRLNAELLQAWPDIDNPPKLSELESLPYLTALIQEALRLSYGAVFRLPRTSHKPIQYRSYVIPPGTPFSTSIYYLHHNEAIFPSSHTFDPSRWLADPVTGRPPVGPDGEKLLTRYLNPFSRGTRQCLGMHLAYAELYIYLANLFRRCRVELYGTTERDVKMHSEQFIAVPHPKSEGIRVLIH